MSGTIGGAFALYMQPIANIGSRSFDEIITRNPDYTDQVDDDMVAGLTLPSSRFPPVVMPAVVHRNQALFMVGTPAQILQFLSARRTEHINVVDGTASISFRRPSSSDKTANSAAGIAKGVLAVVAHPAGVLAAGGIGAALSPSSYDSAAVMRRRLRIEREKTDPAVVQVACVASNAFAAAAPPAAAGPPAVGNANSHFTLFRVAKYLEGCGFS